jgi:outer membrane protein assembly factor BamB
MNFGAVVMLRSSPAVVKEIVYIGSVDGNLYALDVNNGNVLWKYETGGIITSSPTVADGAVYFTSEEPTEGALYKVKSSDGALIWRKAIGYLEPFTGGTDMQCTPTVAGGMVFVSTNVMEYYGINASTGETVWTYNNPAATEFIVSTPIYVNGELFIVDKFDIACLNAKTGDKIRSSYSGDELYVAPSYADGKIYVVTSQRRIFIISAVNGDVLTYTNTASASWSSPTLVDGNLYIGNNDWNIYCFTTSRSSEGSSNQGNSHESLDDYVYALVGLATVVVVVAAVYVYSRSRKTDE